MSVDPLAEKYPGWSAYQYAADNPLKFVDFDGRKIVLGSWLDRALNSVFGYKTDNLKYVEAAATRLRQSETGAKVYNELDAIPQEIVVTTGNLPATSEGVLLGKMQPSGSVKENRFDGATITLDPEHMNLPVKYGKETQQDAPAVTLGHELGHAKAAKENLKKYVKEVGKGKAEDVQALPYENKVREELRKRDEEERNKDKRRKEEKP